ncbi:MAG: NUDIX hydrolase [Hyphomicrobium sp.]
MTVYACGIPVRHGKLLLGKRSAHRKIYPNCWDVIGGKVEAGETVDEALARELREELGVTPTRHTHLGAAYDAAASPGRMLTYELFVVHKWTGGEPSIRDHEHTRLGWFDPEEACALPELACAAYKDFFRRIGVLIQSECERPPSPTR